MYSKEELHTILKDIYQKSSKKYITIADVCKELKIGQSKLHQNFLDVNGYEACPDVFMHIKKPIRVFENIDLEAAYWLGYLMADGCIAIKQPKNENQNITFRLMLECKTEDKEIIEKFCDFLDIRKNRITSGHQGQSVALSITTASFTTDFSTYGLEPNKSHTENHLPEVVKNDQHLFFQYLKGLMDGDGTVHTFKGSPGVSFVSNSQSLLLEIKEELEKYLPENTSIWIMEKTKEQQKGKQASQSLFTLKIGSGIHQHSNLKFLYDEFYNNGKVILTRKQKLLESLIV